MTRNETVDPQVMKKTGKYNGRHTLLRLISKKSLSTKKFLLRELQEQVKGGGAKEKFGKLAKRLGVKIKKLELE